MIRTHAISIRTKASHSMSTNHKPQPDEVEHLLRNAELRDELEPYFDESIRSVNVDELPTPVENEFLASMLAWERAPDSADRPVVRAGAEAAASRRA